MSTFEAVKIRKLPDWVMEAHRARAKKLGVSLEEELRRLLTDSALRPQAEFATKAAAWAATLEAKYGKFSDGTELIREARGERG